MVYRLSSSKETSHFKKYAFSVLWVKELRPSIMSAKSLIQRRKMIYNIKTKLIFSIHATHSFLQVSIPELTSTTSATKIKLENYIPEF